MARKPDKSKLKRHLDHLPDMTEGVAYTQIPEPLRTLWFDGDMPAEKVRLTAIILSHAATFHIKSSYLRDRFHQRTITKYIKELVEDKVIRTEKVKLDTGGYATVYHTNPISDWDLREVRQKSKRSSVNVRKIDERSRVNGSSMNGSSMNGSSVNALNETKGNETKGNENMGGMKITEDEAKETPHPIEEGKPWIYWGKQVQHAFQDRKGFVDYRQLNRGYRNVWVEYGDDGCQEFSDWLLRCWNRVRQGQWLGPGDPNPREFMLNVRNLDDYFVEWKGKFRHESSSGDFAH